MLLPISASPYGIANLEGYSGRHGYASSPIVVGDLVCLQCDDAEQGFLLGVEAGSGNVRWQAKRPAGKTSYSTPCVVSLAGGGQAVISHSTTGGIGAIEVQSGHQLWQLPEDFLEQGALCQFSFSGGQLGVWRMWRRRNWEVVGGGTAS